HLLATDLSDAELVLGKLAARLLPVLALAACPVPVLFGATLLGGIDPQAAVGATLVTLGVAVLGCTLALTLSVWGRKTHEVLLAVTRVRTVGRRRGGRPARPGRRRLARLLDGPARWLPGPSLDGNPVLWREWHHRRSSRWGWAVWALYGLLAGLFSLVAVWTG